MQVTASLNTCTNSWGILRRLRKNGINKGDAYWDWNTWQYIDPNANNTSGYNDGIITAADIKQINNYYPFGLNMEGNWNGAQGDNKYQYNGKEWNDDFGLGWNDYGARFYDPAVGRWHSIDPKTDKYKSVTPYNYVMNRPTVMVDPDGKEAIYTVNRETNTVTVTATIYVTGKYASTEKTQNVQDRSKDFLKNGTFKDSDGKTWNINYDVSFKYAEKKDVKDLGRGENILKDEGSSASAVDRWDMKAQNGVLRKNAKATEVVHEGVHMIGLQDRYDHNTQKSHEGYETDLMGASPTDSATTFSDKHNESLGNWALRNTDPTQKESTTLSGKNVDWKNESHPKKD